MHRRIVNSAAGGRRYYFSLSFTNYCHKFEMDIYNKLC